MILSTITFFLIIFADIYKTGLNRIKKALFGETKYRIWILVTSDYLTLNAKIKMKANEIVCVWVSICVKAKHTHTRKIRKHTHMWQIRCGHCIVLKFKIFFMKKIYLCTCWGKCKCEWRLNVLFFTIKIFKGYVIINNILVT